MGLIKKKDKAEIPSKKVGLGIMMEEIKRKQEEMGLRNMEEGVSIPIYLTDLKNMEKAFKSLLFLKYPQSKKNNQAFLKRE